MRARDNRMVAVGHAEAHSPISYDEAYRWGITALPNPNNRVYRGDPVRGGMGRRFPR